MVLDWNKPEKIMSVEDWKSISADGCPAGVYTPNMSEEDKSKWKAKLIKGKNPRVEIRKTFQKSNGKPYPDNINYYAQNLIVVSLNPEVKDCNIIFSLNGKAGISFIEMQELQKAIDEAVAVLKKI